MGYTAEDPNDKSEKQKFDFLYPEEALYLIENVKFNFNF